MLILSPILLFQKSRKEEMEQLANSVRSNWLNTSLTYALAEMSARNATKEELIGARIFIGILLNLPEPVQAAPPALPSKELGQKPEEKKEA